MAVKTAAVVNIKQDACTNTMKRKTGILNSDHAFLKVWI